MTTYTQEQIDQQTKMFGCTIDDMKEGLIKRDYFRDPTMMAMAILSDAQEELAHGHAEDARQFINRAKWLLSEVGNYCREHNITLNLNSAA